MNTLEAYNRYEQARATEVVPRSSGERSETNLYAAALLTNIERQLAPANLSEEEILLGYAHKEEAVVALNDGLGLRAPNEVRFTVCHGDVTSDLTADPVWGDETPDHLRSGWHFSTRELRAAQEWLGSGTDDDETAAILRGVIDEQTDSLSLLAVSVVTGGAVLPDSSQRSAQQFDLAA